MKLSVLLLASTSWALSIGKQNANNFLARSRRANEGYFSEFSAGKFLLLIPKLLFFQAIWSENVLRRIVTRLSFLKFMMMTLFPDPYTRNTWTVKIISSGTKITNKVLIRFELVSTVDNNQTRAVKSLNVPWHNSPPKVSSSLTFVQKNLTTLKELLTPSKDTVNCNGNQDTYACSKPINEGYNNPQVRTHSNLKLNKINMFRIHYLQIILEVDLRRLMSIKFIALGTWGSACLITRRKT